MAKLSEPCVQKLKNAGLFLSRPAPSSHVWPEFILVGKPVDVPGNHIPGYSTAYVLDFDQRTEISFDAPPVRVWFDGEFWFVLAEDYCPGPGPGDFLDEWSTQEQAVEDILDFYFGDPARMQAKAEARKKPYFNPGTDDDSVKSASA
jgi:hypothetical protein